MAEITEYPKQDPSLFWAAETLKKCALNWLIPGLGYKLNQRNRPWLILSLCVYVAFFMGLLQGGDFYGFLGEGKLRLGGAICQAGMGLPYLIAKFLVPHASPLNPTYDYGTNYLLMAGMINWLATIDTFDIAVKRK